MLLEELVAVSNQLAAHRSRLKKVELLSDCLGRLSEQELPVAVKFLCGKLTQGKIGVGPAAVQKAIDSLEMVGEVEQVKSLTLLDVNHAFEEISDVAGKGATKRRAEQLLNLFQQCSADGVRFLARLLFGEMRHGAVEGAMSEAIGKMNHLDLRLVRKAAMLSGDLARVAVVARTEGQSGIDSFAIELFRPLQPMLAEPSEDMKTAMHHLGESILEYKLDGVRIQAHKDGDEVKVFTRHLKEVTASVPEVVDLVRRSSASRLILDGEVLALRENGRPFPFQTTMRRFGRRNGTDLRDSLPLTAKFFDCLLFDHQDMLDDTTTERHEALSSAVRKENLIERITTNDIETASQFLRAAMKAGHEGVMAKSIDATYAAGGRGKSWLKIKPSHTLDLVILAAEWGSGRRKGWLSNLHLGARVGSGGEFAMIGKTFKGLTDKLLQWQTEQLLQLETHREDYVVYVKPQLVAEIAFNEVQQSPHYDSGFALRFARVKRYRADKTVSEADTIGTVEQLFREARK